MSSSLNNIFQTPLRRPFMGQPQMKFFSDRIVIYSSVGDIVNDPLLMWKNGNQQGLIHTLLQYSNRVLPGSEITFFLNEQIYSRITRDWYRFCIETISPKYHALMQERNIQLRFEGKPLHFGFSSDNNNGIALGLRENEFAVGIFDNRHRSTEESLPLVQIKAHIESQSDSFQELGILYNDQIAWSLGAHALDTVRIEQLQIPCALLVQQDERGLLTYQTNPAYDHLWLRPIPNFSNRHHLIYKNRVLMTLIFEVFELNRRTIDPSILLDTSTKTLHLSFNKLQLKQSGCLIQKNHFPQFMSGFYLYLHKGGILNSHRERAFARFRIEESQVWFKSLRAPCFLNDRIFDTSQEVVLEDNTKINNSGLVFTFLAHSLSNQSNWAYLGELRFQSASQSLKYGKEYVFGRDPSCFVSFPNETDNSNIIWKPEFAEQSHLPIKGRQIAKSLFNTYSIMVGPQHAILSLTGDPSLRVVQHKYPSYIRRGDLIFCLKTPERKRAIQSGDEILIGNQIFTVMFQRKPIWQDAEEILLDTPLYRALIT